MTGSWAELFRWFLDDGSVDPFEVRRRAGRVRVSALRVLDLTDADVRLSLAVDDAELTANDYTTCQAIADAAQATGLDGILPPAAALPGGTTLVVFASAVVRPGVVTAMTDRVCVPPINIARRLGDLRPKEHSRAQVAAYVRALTRLPAAER